MKKIARECVVEWYNRKIDIGATRREEWWNEIINSREIIVRVCVLIIY